MESIKISVTAQSCSGIKATAEVSVSRTAPALTVYSLIIPERQVHEGILIRSTSDLWAEIVQRLNSDWSAAYQLRPEQWEELVAGAFQKAGYE
jgi:restriction system protein